VERIIENGGIVLAGTDSTLDNPATALHLNLRAQVKFRERARQQVLWHDPEAIKDSHGD
jgi:hypothetical protein